MCEPLAKIGRWRTDGMYTLSMYAFACRTQMGGGHAPTRVGRVITGQIKLLNLQAHLTSLSEEPLESSKFLE